MTTRATTNDTPGYGWLIGMSAWMLLTVIPGPLLAWLGFGIVGVASRKPRLIALAGAVAVVAIIVNLPMWGDWQPVAATVAYLAGMVAALVVNPIWLRTMWERRLGRAAEARSTNRRRATTGGDARSVDGGDRPPTRSERRAAQRRAAAAERAARAEAAAEAEAARTAQDEAETTRAAEAKRLAAAAGASADRYLESDPQPVEPAEPIDVNTASARELEALPGVTRSRARKAVKERDAQGGFTSVEDFGESMGLQPHEIVRLRRVASCSPRPRGERRFGRRVDY